MPGNQASPATPLVEAGTRIETPQYLRSFATEDRERIFNFFTLFSRWEYALKQQAKFRKTGRQGETLADWDKFADAYPNVLSTIDYPGYPAAREYLLGHPPLRLMYEGFSWQGNPQRESETEARYFLRIIRDVRNNLFHGGKYQAGPMNELARDRKLIDSAITALLACITLDPEIRFAFEART